jgi:predicted GIY-YIG superfamily endonuclease
MNIYAIELDCNKYYIGKTSRDVNIRFQEHKNENGSEWTSFYKPVKIIEHYQSESPFEEDTLTKKYMMKYGIDNVRGGSYTKMLLDEWQIKSLEHEFKSVSDCCYKCGQKGHFAYNCPGENFQGTNEELEEKINELEEIKRYIIEIKPHQYLSKESVEQLINSSYTYNAFRKILIKNLKSQFCCPYCKSNDKNRVIKISNDARKPSLRCVECECVYNAVIKNSYKLTFEAYENLPKNTYVKYGALQTYSSSELNDNQSKIQLYKTFINNAKLENKYNKFIETLSINDDKKVIENIENMLVNLWRQLALRF